MNEDAARELDKAAGVLKAVHRYLDAYNVSMAALHMSEQVMQSPLTAAVEQAVYQAEAAAARFRT